MWQEPVVSETRALRDDYARQFNCNIEAKCKDLMAQQASHPARVVSYLPRKPAIVAAAPSKSRRSAVRSYRRHLAHHRKSAPRHDRATVELLHDR